MSTYPIFEDEEEALEEIARKVHPYKVVFMDGYSMRSEITLRCKEHGRFTRTVRSTLRGSFGCMECKKVERHEERFLKAVRRKFKPPQYDTTDTRYPGRRQHLTVICKDHGPFSFLMDNLDTCGCVGCKKVYQYHQYLKVLQSRNPNTLYVRDDELFLEKSKYRIVCQEHGEFVQSHRLHFRNGSGCPSCGSLQNPAKYHKWKSKMYSMKTITLPDGRIVKVQGYEDRAIKYLLQEIPAKRIRFDKDVPSIPYTFDGKQRVYYPDLRVGNTLIEVKSTWTVTQGTKLIKAKLNACRRAGYRARILVFDKDGVVLDQSRAPVQSRSLSWVQSY